MPDFLPRAALNRLRRRIHARQRLNAQRPIARPASAPAPQPAAPEPARAATVLKLLRNDPLTRGQAIFEMAGDRNATAAAFDWLRDTGRLEQLHSLPGKPWRARAGDGAAA